MIFTASRYGPLFEPDVQHCACLRKLPVWHICAQSTKSVQNGHALFTHSSFSPLAQHLQ